MIKFKDKPLRYLCTVYSAHAKGLDAAYTDASYLLGALLNSGVRVFCPIAHCHTSSKIHNLPTSFDWWMDLDEGYIDKCDEVLVTMMDGWSTSKGISHEIAYALKTGKPVRYLNPVSLEIFDTLEEAYAKRYEI